MLYACCLLIKDLEAQLETYREEKRKLQSEMTKIQQESNDRHFKVNELERVSSL